MESDGRRLTPSSVHYYLSSPSMCFDRSLSFTSRCYRFLYVRTYSGGLPRYKLVSAIFACCILQQRTITRDQREDTEQYQLTTLRSLSLSSSSNGVLPTAHNSVPSSAQASPHLLFRRAASSQSADCTPHAVEGTGDTRQQQPSGGRQSNNTVCAQLRREEGSSGRAEHSRGAGTGRDNSSSRDSSAEILLGSS